MFAAMYKGIKEWIYQNTIAWDQALNALFNGSADESYSSRCFRCNYRNPYKWIEPIVNVLFCPFQGPDHCRNAYYKELRGRHLPTNFYDRAWEMNEELDRRAP